ncbi:MAG: haloacid dehalogenase [bacterium]
MERFNNEIERLKNYFDGIDKEREKAYIIAREMRRDSVQAVRVMHRGKFDEARELIAKATVTAGQLSECGGRFGFAEEAHQEYVEAALTLAFLLHESPPTQEELKTTERGYLLGLADAIGELRRHILGLLTKGDIENANEYMDLMDDLFGMIMKFDHTDAVLPLRRKQDAFRSIIERTRGDLTNIICQRRLEKCITDSTVE